MNDSRGNPSAESEPSVGSLVPVRAGGALTRDPYGPGPYGGSAPNEFAVNLLEYWRILNKRKGLIASVAVAFLALGTLATLMTTPLYTATVRLQIDRNVSKIVEGGNITPVEGADVEFLRTQYELLQSRNMAERVASALKLGNEPEFLNRGGFSLLGSIEKMIGSASSAAANRADKATLERAAVGMILANRAVRPVAGSRLVDIMYSDPVPAQAQRIATAIADAFIAANLDKRFQANSYAKTFLEDQIKQLKLRLEESERVLLEFAQSEQIVVVTEKSSIAESNLAAANAALGALASERIKNEQLWMQVEPANAINMPQLLTNGVIDGLRARRNALVTEYQEKLETFKPGYPAMIQIDNKIKEIDRQLASEVQTIKSAFKAAYESFQSQEAEMKKRIDILKAEVLDLQKRSIQYNILKREVDTNRSLYDGLLHRFKEVDIAGGAGANNVFVVDRAEVPRTRSSPQLSRNLLLSLAFGLGAGLFAAYVLERLDDTIKSADEAERITGLATLGLIPKISADKSMEEEFLDPRSGLAEAYRSLCTSLQFSTVGGLPRTLLITSAGPSEGKSFTSLAIAKHFASMGQKVLLIDSDLRNPSLHTKLGLDKDIGFSNYLTGASTPPETFQKTPIANLAFMASGPLPPNAADLLAGTRLFSMLSVGLEVFDLIVLDGPPVMGLADAPLLSSAAAATVFVVGAGQVRTALVRAALGRLQYARGTLLGTVICKYDARAAGYGYGYGYGSYGYGYGYRYGGEEKAPPPVPQLDRKEPQLARRQENAHEKT